MGLNKNDFLEKDIQQAISEYRAAWSCISRIEEKLTSGDLKEVKLTCVDLINSVREIEKLHSRKEHHERLCETVEEFAKCGIDLTIVNRVVS
ncbi:YqaH family protein [Sutcliffiella cohnii]